MNFAPGAILVSVSGCFLDWLITRAWGRIMLLAIPGLVGMTIYAMSIWGSLLSKPQLAAWYLSLGEKELKKIDENWAFGGSVEKSDIDLDKLDQAANTKTDGQGKALPGKSGAATNAKSKESSSTDSKKTDASKKDIKVPRFAEAAFRRAQQLHSDNPEIIFAIAATMSQQGSLSAANNLLRQVAADDKEGHHRSHALIAYNMLRLGVSPDQRSVIKHHLNQATKFNGTPAQLLVLTAQLAFQERNFLRAIDLLKRAAASQPEYYLQVLEAAQASGSEAEGDIAARRARLYFDSLIERGEDKPLDRLMLAQVLISYKKSTNDDLVKASQLLDQGLNLPSLTPEESQALRRGLSEVLRARFKRSLVIMQGEIPKFEGNIELLDQAMRVDPTNPGVPEEISILVRFGGDKPPQHMIDQLEEVLAKGTATPLTHAMLSEAFHLQGNFEKSIYHSRKLLDSQPMNAQHHNNLAYNLASRSPADLTEALEHAELAVRISPTVPDFLDTLGLIYIKLKRYSDAITKLEFAIEISTMSNKPCPDFHQRIAEAYRMEGNQRQSDLHLKIAEDQRKQMALDEIKKKQEAADQQKKGNTRNPSAPSGQPANTKTEDSNADKK